MTKMIIKELTLFVNDIALTKAFYTDKLGAELIIESATELVYQFGQTKTTFKATEEAEAMVYHFAFNIAANKLEEAKQWASERFTLMPNYAGELVTVLTTWKSESLYFFDDNGNLVEFIAREDVGESERLGFDASHIVSISEIGLVVDEPLKTAAEWIAKYGIHFFDKAEPTKDFLALGDDEGLIIFVSKSRHWFPTQIVAKSYPLNFSIAVGDEIHRINMD